MSDAPERIFICPHVGEYGLYFPEAVEAEGEYGGEAVPYVPAARIAALEAQLARLKLFIASDVSRAAGLMNSLMPGPLSHDDTHEAYLRRMSALFTAEAEKLDAGVSAALSPPPEGETP